MARKRRRPKKPEANPEGAKAYERLKSMAEEIERNDRHGRSYEYEAKPRALRKFERLSGGK